MLPSTLGYLRSRPFTVVLMAVVLLPLASLAQPPDTSWTRAYGGTDIDVGGVLEKTPDGGYLLVGWTYSFGSGGSDLYLIRTDSIGDTLWSKVYGGPLNDGADAIVPTPDSCYLVSGLSYSFATGADVWLVKVDPNGDTLWTRTYGYGLDDMGNALARTADTAYIVAGTTNNLTSLNDIYLLKIDQAGDTLWTSSYGGQDNEYCYAVQQTPDGGFIMAGRTESFGAGGYDAFLAKANSGGDFRWLKTYGGAANDYAYALVQAADGGFLVAGHTRSFGAGDWDVYLIRTDSIGDTLWTKTYGGIQPDEAFSIEKIDVGYLVAGATFSYGAGQSDMYLLRIDSNGDTLWTGTYGGADDDWAYHATGTIESAYVILGYSQSFGPGYVDVYLVKTEADAGVCRKKGREQGEGISITASPNPFTSTTTIHIPCLGQGAKGIELQIYDITGRLVHQFSIPSFQFPLGRVVWEASGIAPGIYFLSVDGIPPQKLIKLQ